MVEHKQKILIWTNSYAGIHSNSSVIVNAKHKVTMYLKKILPMFMEQMLNWTLVHSKLVTLKKPEF